MRPCEGVCGPPDGLTGHLLRGLEADERREGELAGSRVLAGGLAECSRIPFHIEDNLGSVIPKITKWLKKQM